MEIEGNDNAERDGDGKKEDAKTDLSANKSTDSLNGIGLINANSPDADEINSCTEMDVNGADNNSAEPSVAVGNMEQADHEQVLSRQLLQMLQ